MSTEDYLKNHNSELDKLKKENERLLALTRKLQKENSSLSKQLKWCDSTSSVYVKESKFNVGKQEIYSSQLETMRAMFSNYEVSNKKNFIMIKSVPSLHEALGELLTEEEGKEVVKEISELAKLNEEGEKEVVSFEQFVSWWSKRFKEKHHTRFNLISIDVKSKGKFKLKRIKKQPVGKMDTLAYRVRYFYNDKENHRKYQISPWHDIPLYNVGSGENAKLLNFVCEIPKWTRAKFEIATREKYNPIKQDVKFGKLRYYQHGDMMFNYGLLPQTWENPEHISEDTGKKGDNDPIDAIELGTRQLDVGEICVVKVLGLIALIDSGETDWKIICINIEDPLANKLQDIEDVESYIPGCITAIREYFRIYKVCTGNEPNYFSFGEMPKGKEYALKIIHQTHKFWEELRKKDLGVVKTPTTTNVPNVF